MIKENYDFRQLSVNIVKDTLKDFASEYYALGNTKIFMMLEVVALFDKAV
jgi:myosin heavy subunit